ncbi:peptidoglycan DD-metalloendopeptidase family protein [Jeongeupia sp. USM3]|uniref:peptidoglycan DD-metalloendopeptidase family protein n=1 Tax=Jeongeupia sp. USM3 TaxID=1906741 RepID=UPI0009F24202|nr:peptidoglycan DD-metalloendopeptidase family protein [Jeongeupia sp. USM3]
MIISPPILKIAQGTTPDHAWLEALMPLSSGGNYPISDKLAWHGGQHIAHTDAGGKAEPVRAIADGEVVFVRESKDADQAPLKYEGATNNGCVVIKHKTEIGEGPEGGIEYYSIYMHLKQVFLKKKQPVNRKDILGSVGVCNGKNAMHLEVICDDKNLKRIVGRTSGLLDISKDGRSHIVYGDIHFYLPVGTKFFANDPGWNAKDGIGAPTYTSTDPLWISMSFDKGACNMHTRQKNQQAPSGFQSVGEILPDGDKEYEYNIHKKATKLADANNIAPSAAYELLRFGRVINSLHETSILAGTVPHWRKISYPGGSGWANINNVGVTKFSDADFPHWLGWNLVDDDSTPDSQCNSSKISDWITNKEKKLNSAQVQAALNNETINKLLRHSICKFPTEWEKNSVDARYRWLKKKSDLLDKPMDEAEYLGFCAHIESLCFWEEAGLGIENVHWHFHPAAFIEIFRKCSWLSSAELARVYPDALYNKSETPDPAALKEKYRVAINWVVSKYLVSSNKTRLTHFLGQGAVESFFLARMQETSVTPSRNPNHPSVQPETNGFYSDINDKWFHKYNNNANLANGPAPDGVKYRGRGMKQLTGRLNHNGYWIYRGWRRVSLQQALAWHTLNYKDIADISDPQRLSTVPNNCIDAGGFYWDRGAARAGYRSMNKLISANDVTDVAIKKVTMALNGFENGLDERIKQTKRISEVVLDAK